MNPHVFTCGYSGLIFGLLSFKTVLLAIGAIVTLYYGWPMIEKLLLILPIPDPKSIKDKIMGMAKSSKGTNSAG